MASESIEAAAILTLIIAALCIVNVGMAVAGGGGARGAISFQANTTGANASSTSTANATSSSTLSSSSTSISSSTLSTSTLPSSTSTTIPGGGGGANLTVTGPFPSSLVQTAFCYLMRNFTSSAGGRFTLNGTLFNVIVNSIGASSAEVAINGTPYGLGIGTLQWLPSSSGHLYFAMLDNISYIPIANAINLTGPYYLEPAIDLTLCGSPIVNQTNTTSSTTLTTTTTLLQGLFP